MKFFPNPKTFLQLGSWTIQMYAVCILIGAFIAYGLGQHHFEKMGYHKDILSDYFLGVLITGILVLESGM